MIILFMQAEVMMGERNTHNKDDKLNNSSGIHPIRYSNQL